MLITNYNSIMHTFYCYNHMYIKRIRDCFLLSFLTTGTIFWSVIIDSVLTWVTRGPLFQRTYDPSALFVLKSKIFYAMKDDLGLKNLPFALTSINLIHAYQLIYVKLILIKIFFLIGQYIASYGKGIG